MALCGVGALAGRAEDSSAAKAQTVRLVVDYGDGVEKHFAALNWKKGLTVLDALNAAKASPHGITFEHAGSGETTFVTRIDDLKNEGARGGKRNWTYRVNEKLVDKGAGTYELKAGDAVRWVYSDKGLKP